MPIVREQFVEQALTGPVNNVTIAAPTNGNLLVVGVTTQSDGAVVSITQTGATWGLIKAKDDTWPFSHAELWYSPNISGAGTSIVVTIDSAVNGRIYVAEYSGILTPDDPVDLDADNTGNEFYGPGAESIQTSGAINADDELVVVLAAGDVLSGLAWDDPTVDGFDIVSQYNDGSWSSAYAEKLNASIGIQICTFEEVP